MGICQVCQGLCHGWVVSDVADLVAEEFAARPLLALFEDREVHQGVTIVKAVLLANGVAEPGPKQDVPEFEEGITCIA